MCFGTYDWTSGDNKGDRYKGEWKKDLQHGQGKYTYANGDEYVENLKMVKVTVRVLLLMRQVINT